MVGMGSNTKSIRGLETVAFESGQQTAMVVFHGYGANCHDLVPVRELVSGQEGFDWYFPNGPLSVPIGMGMMGRAWFPVRIGQLGASFTIQVPQGFQTATEQAKALVEEVKQHHSKVYVGGFSQGAMIATNIVMQWPQLIHKLFMLSGTLLNEGEWREQVVNMRDIPTFQSHGRQDMVLPFAAAEELNQLFRDKPDHQFHPFAGGHEIPPSILQSLSRFLDGHGS